MKKSAVIFFSTIFPMLLSAETVRLIPSRDTDVYAFTGNPTSSTFSLGVSTTPLSSSTLHSQKSLMEFDFSTTGIPASEIKSAVLRLFILPTDPAYGTLTPGDVHLHVQGKSWGSSPNWSSFDPQEKIGLIPASSISDGQWVELDITHAVKNWVSGTTANHGLVMKPLEDQMTPGLNVSFAASETEEDGLAPEIIITRLEVPPKLAIQSVGGVVSIEWPVASSEGWTLYWAEDPAGPWEMWNEETATITTDVTAHRLVPALSLTKAFFRLQK